MNEPEKPLGLLQIVGSVLASFFGVQSSRTRTRDFTRGRVVHFLLVGLLITAGFVLVLWLIVKLVLRHAS